MIDMAVQICEERAAALLNNLAHKSEDLATVRHTVAILVVDAAGLLKLRFSFYSSC